MAITARAGDIVIVGIERRNVELLRKGHPFHKHLNELGLPFQLVIFYGDSTDDLKNAIKEFVTPDTNVVDHTDRKPQ